MQATDVLREEHEVIQQVLDCLEELARRADRTLQLEIGSVREALDFLATFADRCHHEKEEQRLFPALEERGLSRQFGPLAVMLAEHDQGRTLIRTMRAATADVARNPAGSAQRFAAAARSYVGLLRDHIAKENGVLFPLADRTLSESEKRALALGFERVEHEDMGPGTHERYLALARGLCERLGVAWVPHAIATHACCGHRDGCP